jgi:hypothetical protein
MKSQHIGENLPTMRNSRGEWVPAIQEPYYGIVMKTCSCGRRFFTIDGYKGHYAYKHILNPDKDTK